MATYTYVPALQKDHKEVYETFFSKYNLVISLPHIFRFGHSLGKGSSYLAIRQKIPHHLYLGVNIIENETATCSFASWDQFDHIRQEFVGGDPYVYMKEIDAIEVACSRIMSLVGLSYSCEFGVLTEYARGSGTSFSTTLFTLLAMMFFILEKKIPLEVITNYSFQHTAFFSDIALLACYIKYLVTGSVGTCLPFVVLGQQTTPTFHIGTIDFSGISSTDIQQRLRNLSRCFALSSSGEQKKLLGQYALIAPQNIKKNIFPLDIAIIHLGTSYTSLGEQELTLHESPNQASRERFSSFIEEQGLRTSLENLMLSPLDVYSHLSTVLYVRLFHACIEAVKAPHDRIVIQNVLSILQDMGAYHCFLEHHYEMISLLTTVFASQRVFPEESCAFLPLTTVVTGGTFLAIFPRYAERDTFEHALRALEKDHGYTTTLLYASRKESFPNHGGVHIQQYISEDIFSSYITQHTLQVSRGDGSIKIGKYDDIFSDPILRTGLTFDLIKKKILVKGEKVTHKVFCSQSATIEIILYLLDHIGEPVPNRLLPPSAYSKNKNEMTSKIVLPLQEMLAQIGCAPLDIVCSGMLYDWTMCLRKKPDYIHVIHYVH